jgi:hypothetical protein
MYVLGLGVPYDYAEGLRWFRKAAVQRDANGQYSLGWMYESGRGVTRDDAEAARW